MTGKANLAQARVPSGSMAGPTAEIAATEKTNLTQATGPVSPIVGLKAGTTTTSAVKGRIFLCTRKHFLH